MKKNLLFLFCLLTSLQYGMAQTGTIQHDSLTRDYIVHVPASYDGNTAVPLVVNMHGLTSNAAQQQAYSQFNLVADANNFIVVYPNGVDNAWNSGGFSSNVDDVGFISALIDHLDNLYNINNNQVFATGMSNGGFMSYRLACELEDKIAAIASVTGLLSEDIAATCQTNRPVPVMQIHGTADPTVDYNGSWGYYLSAESTVDFWVQRNSCTGAEMNVVIPDTDTTDGCTAERFYYEDCDNATGVEFYRIQDGGHTWPGSFFTIGVTNRDFSASEVIWAFFRKHSVNGAPTANENQEVALLSVTPNPTTEYLDIQFDATDLETLAVYNLAGQKMLSRTITGGTSLRLSTENWPAGVYFVQAAAKNGLTKAYKIIKQ